MTLFHALPHLVDEGVGNEIAQRVVGEDERFEVDVVPGLSDGRKQSQEEVAAPGVDVHLVVLEGKCQTLVGKEAHQGAVLSRHAQVLLLGKLQHGALDELVEALLADDAFLPRVLSERRNRG